MGKKMLINATDFEEYRVAIVENGILEDLDIETTEKEQLKGNIYKGIVVKIEPSLQAAFVDFGVGKAGFLSFSEIQPACYIADSEKNMPRRGRPRIQDVIKRGQELLVQIIRGERDTKGAALTTYISLPGRYLVLMPGSDSNGVSRKIEDEEERKKLRELIKQLNLPEGMGCIVRTAGLGRHTNELAKDLNYLLRLWNKILDEKQDRDAPSLIYQESDLVIRTIRDYFTSDIKEVLIDNKDVYAKSCEFFKAVMPRYYRLVKLYREKKPLFSKYNLEEQTEKIYERKVPLKSGGSIIIDPTEALVAIDVNSGRSIKEKSIEDTAFKTNIEAAEEIARQLRLRDLAGLIVIDFIDMKDTKHMREVERCFRNSVRKDKAKIQFSRISTFGIMELSRQRIKPSLTEGSHVLCSQCQGTGVIKSIKSLSISILRKLQSIAAKEELVQINTALPLGAASYLLNSKREALFSLEKEFDVKITIQPNPQFSLNQYSIEIQRKDKAAGSEIVSEKVKYTQDISEIAKQNTRLEVPYQDSIIQGLEDGRSIVQTGEEISTDGAEKLVCAVSLDHAPAQELTYDERINASMKSLKPPMESPYEGMKERTQRAEPDITPTSSDLLPHEKIVDAGSSQNEWSYSEEKIGPGRSMSPYLIMEALGEHYLEFIIDPSEKKAEESSPSEGHDHQSKESDVKTDRLSTDSLQSKEEVIPAASPVLEMSAVEQDISNQTISSNSKSDDESGEAKATPTRPIRKRRYYYRRRPKKSQSPG